MTREEIQLFEEAVAAIDTARRKIDDLVDVCDTNHDWGPRKRILRLIAADLRGNSAQVKRTFA